MLKGKYVIFLSVVALSSVLLGTIVNFAVVFGWSNGGFSDDPSNPKYGTHDWIAQHALDWQTPVSGMPDLPLEAYLYGTELPDNWKAPDGIGDTAKHHVYDFANGSLQDDASAIRAQQEYNNAVNLFRTGDLIGAAKRLGVMSHYISDLAVFGHVMGASTDWGDETHHSDYEDYVNERTNSYVDEFNSFLIFDGVLSNISAYDAALALAYDTTFDVDGDLTCVWMDQNYSWSNSTFRNRSGESLNLAVNLLTDVIHTFALEATAPKNVTLYVVINEAELNPTGTDAGNEWIELFNPTGDAVDIGGWTLSTTAGVTVTITIPTGTAIQPYGYWVYTHSSQWLDNANESVVLRDASATEVDQTPLLSDDTNNERAWARFPNGYDTNSGTDWRFQTATKGGSNGRASSTISCSVKPSNIVVGQEVEINGNIVPSHDYATVNITLTKPDKSILMRTVATNASGFYQDFYTPDETGTWTASASWQGDYDHQPASSSTFTFNVSPQTYYLTIILPEPPSGTTDPAPGTYSYVNGSIVNVTAIPNDGFSFDYWLLDSMRRDENPITVLMDENHTLQAAFVDNIPPQINSITQHPPSENVQPSQVVKVSVNVTDSGSLVKNVTLSYNVDNDTVWVDLPMPFNLTTKQYEATIPGQLLGTYVKYMIIAYDNARNIKIEDNGGQYYVYMVIPEFLSVLIVPLFIVLTMLAIVFKKRKIRKKEETLSHSC